MPCDEIITKPRITEAKDNRSEFHAADGRHPDDSEGLEQDRTGDQRLADPSAEEFSHLCRVRAPKDQRQKIRHAQHGDRRKLRLKRIRADAAANFDAIANRSADGCERRRQAAAGFPLNGQRRREQQERLQRDTLMQAGECGLRSIAETNPRYHFFQRGAQRLWRLRALRFPAPPLRPRRAPMRRSSDRSRRPIAVRLRRLANRPERFRLTGQISRQSRRGKPRTRSPSPIANKRLPPPTDRRSDQISSAAKNRSRRFDGARHVALRPAERFHSTRSAQSD